MRKWIAMVVLSLVLAPLAAAAASDEKLSEVEKLKVEKALLLSTITTLTSERNMWRANASQCMTEVGKTEMSNLHGRLNAITDELVEEIEKNHKGYTLSPTGELVKKAKKE